MGLAAIIIIGILLFNVVILALMRGAKRADEMASKLFREKQRKKEEDRNN